MSLAERIEALKFYGCGDEAYELFRATCGLAYQMSGAGEAYKAETLVAWAEDQAYESKVWFEQSGLDGIDVKTGVWDYA